MNFPFLITRLMALEIRGLLQNQKDLKEVLHKNKSRTSRFNHWFFTGYKFWDSRHQSCWASCGRKTKERAKGKISGKKVICTLIFACGEPRKLEGELVVIESRSCNQRTAPHGKWQKRYKRSWLFTATFGSRVQWESEPRSSWQLNLQIHFIIHCETRAPKTAFSLQASWSENYKKLKLPWN